MSAGPVDRARERPVVVVTEGNSRLSIAGLRELWSFREVLTAFAARQVRVRYKQTAIGVLWALVQPVASALVFAVFLGRVANISSDGTPYVAFALVGTVLWSYFSGAASGAMESLISEQAMLRKVYFPRELLPLAYAAAALVDLVPAVLTALVVAIVVGVSPSATWLLLPLPVLLCVIFAIAVGVLLSSINVYYRDVRYALPFVLQIAMFATPVVWSASSIPTDWRSTYLLLNPLAVSIETMRRCLLLGVRPQWGLLLEAFAVASASLLAALAMFKRLERGFADRV